MCFVTFVVIVAFIAVAFSCRLPLSKKCWSLVPVLFAPMIFTMLIVNMSRDLWFGNAPDLYILYQYKKKGSLFSEWYQCCHSPWL